MKTVRERFRQSVRCGTGGAYLILRRHPEIDFSRTILQAAVRNYAYDKQCEGDRAEYVAGLIERSGRREWIVEQVLEKLRTEREDGWGLSQMFSLARLWAEQGNEAARRAMYRRYHRKTIEGFEGAGDDDIAELDGLVGLTFVAKRRGEALLADPEDYEDSFFVDIYQRNHPEVDVYGALRKAARGEPAIRKYLASIRKHKFDWGHVRRRRKRRKPRFSYEEMKEVLESPGERMPVRILRSKRLTVGDLRRVADDFLRERDPAMLGRYLTVFLYRQYPYDYHTLLEIAMGRNSRKYRLVERACLALQYFQGADIRKFALAKLRRTNRPQDYLRLLVSNYCSGDARLLAQIARRYHNEDIIHDLAYGFRDIYGKNDTPECRRPLEILYEKLTCSLCRYSLLEILHKNGVLAERILREMEFDTDEATRKLYRKIRKGQKRPGRLTDRKYCGDG